MTQANTRPLLEWLLLKYPDTPKNRAKQWVLAGRVSVRGEIIRRPHESLADPGDTLELRGRLAGTLPCGSGWQIHPRVSLLYLDTAVAVVNKGPGLISVPAPNCGLSALSILADFIGGRLKARGRFPLPPAFRRLQLYPVHRLDQYTSGVFCMAANPDARRHLIAQLRAHTMRREYVAFAEGRAGAARGVWRERVALGKDQLRQHVLSDGHAESAGIEGREAITHFEVIQEYPLADGQRVVTKLRLRLETGLKHQIRVQAAHAGLPLVGDRMYNPALRMPSAHVAHIDFPRQALHAETLTLEHPDQAGTRMSWTAPLPKDLRELETALRGGRL